MDLSAESSSSFRDVEEWAEHYVLTSELSVKLEPPPPPRNFRASAKPLRLSAPGRPREFRLAGRKERTPRQEALEDPHYRARTLHAFFHHELQAAELMCWALLAFPEAEPEFKRGLVGICLDEIRHMNLYRGHIEELGASIGAFGVREWFWKRVPSCKDPLAFVAVMGMGLEAANLEHAQNFAQRFRKAGDDVGALLQERIAKEEIAHVSFGARWFSRWTGNLDFTTWADALPPPLSPWVFRGEPLAREARKRAGMTDDFLAALVAFEPTPKGRPISEPAASEE
jgi:uncharacterized ferritin-like protein (DUF455 family)